MVGVTKVLVQIPNDAGIHFHRMAIDKVLGLLGTTTGVVQDLPYGEDPFAAGRRVLLATLEGTKLAHRRLLLHHTPY